MSATLSLSSSTYIAPLSARSEPPRILPLPGRVRQRPSSRLWVYPRARRGGHLWHTARDRGGRGGGALALAAVSFGYAPDVAFWEFCELRANGVLRSSPIAR